MGTMQGPVSDQTSGTWELQQLVKSGIFPDANTALRSALRALYQLHPQARTNMVLSSYQSGEISLSKAAAVLGVSSEEMKDIIREAGLQIHFGPQTVEELQEDIENA